MILTTLARVPAWVWVVVVIVLVAGVSHAVQEHRIAALQRQIDGSKEDTAKAASAAVEATLAVIDSRARVIEGRLQALDTRATQTDLRIKDRDASIARTRTEFDTLAKTGTDAEIVDRSRQLGVTALPARRPR